MQQPVQLLHCMLQSPSKRMVPSVHSNSWLVGQHTGAAHKTIKGYSIAISTAGGCGGEGRQTLLIDSWPDFGHGQDAGLNLFWAEIADTYAPDQSFLDTLF